MGLEPAAAVDASEAISKAPARTPVRRLIKPPENESPLLTRSPSWSRLLEASQAATKKSLGGELSRPAQNTSLRPTNTPGKVGTYCQPAPALPVETRSSIPKSNFATG